MRIQDSPRLFVGLTACITLAFGGRASAQTTQVETFTAGGLVTCALPGTPSPIGTGVIFSSDAILQTVDFTPGSVVFNGQPVDFDGHEPSFLASTYQANVATPVGSGPAIVLVTGTGTVIHGPGGGGGGGGCLVAGGDVPLGPTFSANRLDVTPGPGVDLVATVPSWNASAVPQLNGESVMVDGPLNITAVDAVNGIINFTMNGKILAGSAAIPALTTLGSICLAIGLFGLAVLALSRKTPRGSAPSA